MKILTIVVVAIAIGASYYRSRPSTYLPWHNTPEWQHYLSIYDQFIDDYFAKCVKHQIETNIGTTVAYACGNPSNPLAVLLHGAQGTAIMYGKWLVPKLVDKEYYAVAVDFPCDCGRSVPKAPRLVGWMSN